MLRLKRQKAFLFGFHLISFNVRIESRWVHKLYLPLSKVSSSGLKKNGFCSTNHKCGNGRKFSFLNEFATYSLIQVGRDREILKRFYEWFFCWIMVCPWHESQCGHISRHLARAVELLVISQTEPVTILYFLAHASQVKFRPLWEMETDAMLILLVFQRTPVTWPEPVTVTWPFSHVYRSPSSSSTKNPLVKQTRQGN